jgi:exosome complex protein LRP1
VKQYFAKIKLAEEGPAKPPMSLNKQATGRFIKQALAGNDRYDTERAEREAREKLLAARKSKAIDSYRPSKASTPVQDSASSEPNEGSEDDEVDGEDEDMVDAPAEQPLAAKKRKRKNKKKEDKMNGDLVEKPATTFKKLKRQKAVLREEDLELVKPG